MKAKPGFCCRRFGFNAIELIVVILVVFVLLGVVVVAMKNQRDKQRMSVSPRYNLKSVVLANHSCNDIYKRLPPAFDSFGKMRFPASVHVHLLPFVEQDKLYDVILHSNANRGTNDSVPPFLAQQDLSWSNGDGIQNFAANLRVYSERGFATQFDADMPALGPIESGNQAIPRTFGDGTSNTIAFATKLARCGDGGSRYAAAPNSPFAAYFGQNAARVKADPWAEDATYQLEPSKCLAKPLMAQSFTKIGLLVGMADGHARMVNPDLSPRTWNLLVQPNDGMELGDDWNDR
jgi:hypothetical protein